MTNREVMQQALDAIHLWHWAGETHLLMSAHDALREALVEHALHELARLGQEIEQEPVAFYHPQSGFYWAKPTHISAPTIVDVPPMALYTTPPAAQPPPEWEAIDNIIAEYGLQAIDFVADWKAAQRPWQGLTDEDWEKVANRKNTVLDTFEQGATWAAYKLERRNT
jgi:hypothetical protein